MHPNKRFNEYEVVADPGGAYVMVKLTQGQWCSVDIDDWFGGLADRKWHAQWSKSNRSYYAGSISWRREGPQRSIRMSRMVLGLDEFSDLIADHRDRDTLNNRRSNLRACTTNGNARNKNKQRTNASGFIGVSWFKQVGKWRAYIGDGKPIHLGLFETPVEAAKARDAAAIRIHGQFAVLNFPISEGAAHAA